MKIIEVPADPIRVPGKRVQTTGTCVVHDQIAGRSYPKP